jgi:hypothetical protein
MNKIGKSTCVELTQNESNEKSSRRESFFVIEEWLNMY